MLIKMGYLAFAVVQSEVFEQARSSWRTSLWDREGHIEKRAGRPAFGTGTRARRAGKNLVLTMGCLSSARRVWGHWPAIPEQAWKEFGNRREGESPPLYEGNRDSEDLLGCLGGRCANTTTCAV